MHPAMRSSARSTSCCLEEQLLRMPTPRPSVVATNRSAAVFIEDDDQAARMRTMSEQERRIVSQVRGADKASVWRFCQSLRDACDFGGGGLAAAAADFGGLGDFDLLQQPPQPRPRPRRRGQQGQLDRKSRLSVARTQEAMPCGAVNPRASKLVEKVIAQHRGVLAACTTAGQSRPIGSLSPPERQRHLSGSGRQASRTRAGAQEVPPCDPPGQKAGPLRRAEPSPPSSQQRMGCQLQQRKDHLPANQRQELRQQHQQPAAGREQLNQRQHQVQFQHQHQLLFERAHQPLFEHGNQEQHQHQHQNQHQVQFQQPLQQRNRRTASVASAGSGAPSESPPIRSALSRPQAANPRTKPATAASMPETLQQRAALFQERQQQEASAEEVRQRIRFLPLTTALTRSGVAAGDAYDDDADWEPSAFDIRRLTRRRRLDALLNSPMVGADGSAA